MPRFTRLAGRIASLKKFYHIMEVKPLHIIVPICVSFVLAFLDGLALYLMVPLAKGIITNDFTFVKGAPLFKQIFSAFPGIFSALASSDRRLFVFFITAIFAVLLLKNCVSYAGNILSAYWHGKFYRNIHRFIFGRFLTFGKLFFDRTNQQYITTVLGYSGHMMEMLGLFEKSIRNLFTLAACFTVMALISWKLAALTTLIFPVYHYSLRGIIEKIKTIARMKNESWIELNKKAFNILSCIPLVKAYSKEGTMKNVYADINEEIRRLDLKMSKVSDLIAPIQEIVASLFFIAMVMIVTLFIAHDRLADISAFIVFFFAARKTLPLFNVFNNIRASYVKIKAPLKEIAGILDDRDKFYVAEGKKIFTGLQNGIDIKNLSFSYTADRRVLKGINLRVEKGKVTALVGPSGAGKTTLASLLVRFYDCGSGSIFVDGADIRDFTLKSLRGHMALVSQEAMLFNDTLKNNMVFGLDRKVAEEELMDALKKARLYEFVIGLPNGLDTEVGDRGVKLSGGEKQRVSVVRALLKRSEVLILDEATSSLDSKTELLIRQAIDEAVNGRTAIVIAHRLSTIKNADKIVVIEDGRVVEEGPLEKLLVSKGKFFEYWEAQKFF